jgi:hypothetical protein
MGGKAQSTFSVWSVDFGEERSYDVGNVLTGYEVKRSSVKHGAGEVAHEGTGLEMEVADHCIIAPTTDKLNDAGADAATQQGHGARLGSGRPLGR